jgi:hypothetical protein
VVRVVVNDRDVAEFGCGVGVARVAVPSGSSLVTVEALDTTGAIIYRDEFFADANGCGSRQVSALPAEGFVDVRYTLPGPAPSGACFTPGPSFMWVAAWDDIAGEMAVDSAAAPEFFACGSPITFRLAAGSYTLLDTHEVILSGASYVAVARDCTDRPLTVAGQATTSVPSDLADAVSFCP